MNIIPWKPFDELTTLRHEMDTLWDRLFPETPHRERFVTHEWLPSIDLKETKDKLVVKAELPGLDAKDVELSLTDDILTIRGEKKGEEKTKDEHLFFVERYYGKFERKIKLPALVKTGEIDATFKKGILTVNLPKSEEAKKKEIKIKVH
ncbi:MAG: Hsp20/alpha crystallin family protein [Desulfobulbales bacterium]|nr:Hsp20/alpha crystallin family protein [Desulfobulbales bacterium]